MAWPLRVQFPGVLNHVLAPDDDRTPILRDERGLLSEPARPDAAP